MSIATRIENINNNLKNAYDSLEDLGVDLINTDKNLENLSSKIDTLYDEMPKVTGEGTEITLTPTRKGRMQLDLKGNTSQASTTGINLLNLANYSDKSSNGIKLTINSDKSFKIDGTATAGFSYNKNIPNGLVLDGSYTFVLKHIKGTSRNTLTFTLGTGSAIAGTNVQNLKDSGVNLTNFTLENVTATEVRCYFNKNNSFDNDEFQLYLLKGTYTEENLPNYEIFTNGASPNPDYPQPIHVVTGNNSIGVQGKNLFDKNSFTYESGYYDDNGELVSSTSSGHSTNYIGVDSTKTYTISNLQKTYDNDNNYSTVIRVFYWDSLKNWISRSESSSGASSFTFTPPNNCKYITLLVGIGNIEGHVIHNIFTNLDTIQIEEGTATSYVPYYHADYPINLGSLELCKIGDYQDYIYKENGNWYKYEAIDKKILTNSSRKLN